MTNLEKKKVFGQFLFWSASSYVFEHHLLWLALVSLWTCVVVPTTHPKHSHRKHHKNNSKGCDAKCLRAGITCSLTAASLCLCSTSSPETQTQGLCSCQPLIPHTQHGQNAARVKKKPFHISPLFTAWSQALFTSHHSNTTLMTVCNFLLFLMAWQTIKKV